MRKVLWLFLFIPCMAFGLEQLINGDYLLEPHTVHTMINREDIIYLDGKQYFEMDGIFYEIIEREP